MHKILKPLFDFCYQFEVKNTKEAQSLGLDWVNKLLLPVVESVLDEFDVKGIVMRIERLEVDLGDVTLQNITYELPYRCLLYTSPSPRD